MITLVRYKIKLEGNIIFLIEKNFKNENKKQSGGVYNNEDNVLKKRHNDFYLSTQSFMPVLDNLQLEINRLQNYVKKYTALWHVFKY